MTSLLVLAAGMGSRYGGLKQLDPMGPAGETVLDYSLFDAIRAGFDHVVFVIREDFAEAFREGIGSRFADRIRVDYAFQKLEDLPAPFEPPAVRVKPWGTTHAIRAARHLIDGPFAVINADDFYGRDSYAKAAAFLGSVNAGECAMIGYPLVNTLSDHGTVNRGICEISGEDALKGVEEYVKISRNPEGTVTGENLDGTRCPVDENGLVSMNFWLFPGGFFIDLENEFLKFLQNHGEGEVSECYIPTVVDDLIHAGVLRCRVLCTNSPWFGVTYPEDKPHLVKSIRRLIDAGEYPESLI